MYKCFVYLIISENRLVIMDNSVDDKNYHLLMNNEGYDRVTLRQLCKMYCLGYFYAGSHNIKVVNSPYEFQ